MCVILCCRFTGDVYLALSADLQPVQTRLCDCMEAFLLGSRSWGAVDEHMAASSRNSHLWMHHIMLHQRDHLASDAVQLSVHDRKPFQYVWPAGI